MEYTSMNKKGKVLTKIINQKKLTSDCWIIQIEGIEACKKCSYFNTEECGGKEILKTLVGEIKREIKFEGIDDWNRPVFRAVNSNYRFGSVEILFPYGESEESVLKKVSEKHLCYFGNSFNCEPMGTGVENLKIIKIGS